MKKHCIALILTAGGLIAGCHHTAPPAPSVVGPVPARSFVRAGEADLMLQHDHVKSLFLRDELLIVYTRGGDAYSLSRDGLVLQSMAQISAGGGRIAPPVVFQRTIIYPTSSGLEVYNHGGRKLDEIDLHRPAGTPLVGNGSILYMGVNMEQVGRVVAVDPDRPAVPIRWEFLTNSGIVAAPAYANGILYVGTESGTVIAAQDLGGASSPLEIFHFDTGGSIVADLKADDYGVYVASTDTKLYCLDPNTGHIKWQYFAQHPLTQSPTVTATRVYQAVPDVGLVALNKEEGREDRQALWTAGNVAQILSEDERCVYVRMSNNAIAAIDKQTGQLLFRSRRRDFAAFATNTRDATIYAATADGKIYAIQPVFSAGGNGEIVLKEQRIGAEG